MSVIAGKNAVVAAGSEGVKVNEVTAGETAVVYTTGSIDTKSTNGKISGKTVVVAAKNFTPEGKGSEVDVKVDKELVVYNHANGNRPLIAIFNTKEGKDNPDVKNLPNDSIIFLDGRLVGGDIQTVNKLGALEAFPVQTPELKSEQGIFGNPAFLHGQMGIANALAIGAIDFVMLEKWGVDDDPDIMGLDEEIRRKSIAKTIRKWEMEDNATVIGNQTSFRYGVSEAEGYDGDSPIQKIIDWFRTPSDASAKPNDVKGNVKGE